MANSEGKKYLQELGFQPSNSKNDFKKKVRKKLGLKFYNEFMDAIGSRGDGGISDQIYKLRSRDLDTALNICGIYDGNYYGQVCAWYYDHKDYISGKVLDIGCDNGIITCFIASRFPECQIVGIDREFSSIEVAKQLAEKLGLTNVKFVRTDIHQYKSSTLFDTVLSSRMTTECMSKKVREPETTGYIDSLEKKSMDYKKSLMNYAKAISSLIKNDGYYIEMERLGLNQMLLGWELALFDNGFDTIETKEFTTIEGWMKNTFTGFISQKHKSQKTSQAITDNWFKKIIDNAVIEDQRLYGREAQAFLEYYPYDQEEGFLLQPALSINENISFSCGWLYLPEGKKYIEYTVSYLDDSGKRYQVLFFAKNDNEIKTIKEDSENWKEIGVSRKLIRIPHYYGSNRVK